MSDLPPFGEPGTRMIAMPTDANPSGDVFGGWLMSRMALAGGSAASRRSSDGGSRRRNTSLSMP